MRWIAGVRLAAESDPLNDRSSRTNSVSGKLSSASRDTRSRTALARMFASAFDDPTSSVAVSASDVAVFVTG